MKHKQKAIQPFFDCSVLRWLNEEQPLQASLTYEWISIEIACNCFFAFGLCFWTCGAFGLGELLCFYSLSFLRKSWQIIANFPCRVPHFSQAISMSQQDPYQRDLFLIFY